MEYTTERLDELHSTLVEILDYCDYICKQNNLIYFLAGGTALGAKRHHGFIPWDDDLDIVMPRDDYNKLIKIIENDNNELFKIQNEENEKNYFLPFSKIRKQGTIFKEKISEGLYEDNGIYIDIFPLDTIDSRNSLSIKVDIFRLKMIIHALRFRSCRRHYEENSSKFKFIIDYITALPYNLFSNKSLLKHCKKIMSKRNGKERKYVASFGGVYNIQKEIMDYDIYYPPRMVEFEGKLYPSFSKIESYLERMYGDYMKLPPENERHTHEPMEIKF